MRDRGPEITRRRVIAGPGTRTYPTDFLVEGRHDLVFFFWEVSCRRDCIEQNAAAIWRMSVVPSPHFVPRRPKCKSATREWRSITASWLRPRNWGPGSSCFDSRGLTDGVSGGSDALLIPHPVWASSLKVSRHANPVSLTILSYRGRSCASPIASCGSPRSPHPWVDRDTVVQTR